MNNIKLYKLKYFGVEPGEGRSVCYPRLILKGNKILFLTWGIPTADGICIGLYMACIDLFWILYQEQSNLLKLNLPVQYEYRIIYNMYCSDIAGWILCVCMKWIILWIQFKKEIL